MGCPGAEHQGGLGRPLCVLVFFSDSLRACPTWVCPLKMTLHTVNPKNNLVNSNVSNGTESAPFQWGTDVPVELKLQNVSL